MDDRAIWGTDHICSAISLLQSQVLYLNFLPTNLPKFNKMAQKSMEHLHSNCSTEQSIAHISPQPRYFLTMARVTALETGQIIMLNAPVSGIMGDGIEPSDSEDDEECK